MRGLDDEQVLLTFDVIDARHYRAYSFSRHWRAA